MKYLSLIPLLLLLAATKPQPVKILFNLQSIRPTLQYTAYYYHVGPSGELLPFDYKYIGVELAKKPKDKALLALQAQAEAAISNCVKFHTNANDKRIHGDFLTPARPVVFDVFCYTCQHMHATCDPQDRTQITKPCPVQWWSFPVPGNSLPANLPVRPDPK